MRRMLIVEDEPDICDCLQQYFTSHGFSVETAFSGEQALGHLTEDDQPEVVLLDIVLPGISGLEVLRRLKDLYPEARVIMVSAVSDPEVQAEARTCGASGYVTKPFDWSEGTWSNVLDEADPFAG